MWPCLSSADYCEQPAAEKQHATRLRRGSRSIGIKATVRKKRRARHQARGNRRDVFRLSGYHRCGEWNDFRTFLGEILSLLQQSELPSELGL